MMPGCMILVQTAKAALWATRKTASSFETAELSDSMTGREHISLLGSLQGRLCTHGNAVARKKWQATQ